MPLKISFRKSKDAKTGSGSNVPSVYTGAPHAPQTQESNASDGQNDNSVSTFDGFDSWLSTFTPETSSNSGGHETGKPNSDAMKPASDIEKTIPDTKKSTLHTKELIPDTKTTQETEEPHAISQQEPELQCDTMKYETAAVEPVPVQIEKLHENAAVENVSDDSEDHVIVKFADLKGISGSLPTGTTSLKMKITSTIYEMLEQLEKAGFEKPSGFCFKGHSDHALGPEISSSKGCPIYVTDGSSCHDVKKGLKINEDEILSSFVRKVCIPVNCIDNKLDIRDGELKIGFHRTLRVPENGKVHQLPPDFGLLPLDNFSVLTEKIAGMQSQSLANMVRKGGVFLPLYQREAVWISFDSQKPFAIRAYAGGVNVITGKTWKEKKDPSTQDYVVTPRQIWLDGVAVDASTVKQFVAMPTGSGYSIEFQKTEKEDLSGLQFEVIPSGMKTSAPFLPILGPDDYESALDKSPKQFGRKSGDMITCQTGLAIPQTPEMENYKLELDKSPKQCGYKSGQDILFRTGLLTPRTPETRTTLMRELACPGESLRDSVTEAIVPIYKISITIKSYRSRSSDTIITMSPFDTLSQFYRHLPRGMGRNWYDYLYEGIPLMVFADSTTLYDCGIRKENNIIEVWQSARYPFRGAAKGFGGGGPRLRDAAVAKTGSLQEEKALGWEMTLAAGGRIEQIIHKDDHPPSIWDTNLATIINVQLLNSVAYSTLTGKEPPQSPITAAAYKKAGLPFYKEYEANETPTPTPGRGIFGAIKSVGQIDGTKDVVFSANVGRNKKAGCIICKKNFCDRILRPCNHAFCSTCIIEKMYIYSGFGPDEPFGKSRSPLLCAICKTVPKSTVEFSAPMAIPGKDNVDLSKLKVIATGGFTGEKKFQSAANFA